MPSGGQDTRAQAQPSEGRPSSQDWRITCAAAASITLRRRLPVTPASRSARSASAVDSRSSCNRTGTVSIARSASAKFAAWVARARRTPSSEIGSPITTRATRFSRTRSAIARISPGGRPTWTVPSGTARRRSGSLIATPIRTSPRSRPSTRPVPARSPTGEKRAGPAGDRRESRRQLGRAGAARVGEVVLVARTPADQRRSVGEERGGSDASPDRRRRSGRDQDGLAVGVADDDRGGSLLQPVADLDRELPELAGVQRRHVAHDERQAVDIGRVGHQLVDHRRAVAGAKLPELVAQALVLLDDAARSLDRRTRVLRVERADQIAEQRPLDVDLAQRVGTAERLDPPQARADRPFAHEPDHGDAPGSVDVRAPAELPRIVADLDDAHDVAVL